MAMTLGNGNLPERICSCATPGRGAHVAHGNLPDIMLQQLASVPHLGVAYMAMTTANGNLLQKICICAAPGRGAHCNDSGT
eukprot:9695323-Karenia_brevis.AAC.1